LFTSAHGEANYALFIRVFEEYMSVSNDGAIAEVNKQISELLGCPQNSVYGALAELLGQILPLKHLGEYGMTQADIADFTANVMEKQGRLTANNYVPLDAGRIAAIYRDRL
jgi:4-hydroxybutyrate dehydrogenase